MDAVIEAKKNLVGELTVPGDKSISHRALILGTLAHGTTEIRGFLMGEDCLSTLRCLEQLGLRHEPPGSGAFHLTGLGTGGLKEPDDVLNANNSGTTTRLLAGVLAAQPFYSVLTGDESLRQRPMRRVIMPLTQMGAKIWGRQNNNLAPLTVCGGELTAIDYQTSVASAQVKSAVLLAGLLARGTTTYTEPVKSRDHTERMLTGFGARVDVEGLTVKITGGQRLSGQQIAIPGDFSSAAFWLVAALITPGSRLLIKNVGLNPTRTGLFKILQQMGGRLTVHNYHETAGEPAGDLEAQYSELIGVEIGEELIPSLIDEIPILAVACSVARGQTRITGATELRHKETDRLATTALELRRLGAEIEELPDGLLIAGREELVAAEVDSHGDHRLAMSLAIAALRARGVTRIKGAQCAQVSYPGFFEELSGLA